MSIIYYYLLYIQIDFVFRICINLTKLIVTFHNVYFSIMSCQAYCTKTECRKLTINFHKANLEQSILWTPKAVLVSLWKARFSTIFTRRDGRIAVPYRRFLTRLRRRPPHLFSESSTASNSCCEKVLGRKLRLRRKEEGTGRDRGKWKWATLGLRHVFLSESSFFFRIFLSSELHIDDREGDSTGLIATNNKSTRRILQLGTIVRTITLELLSIEVRPCFSTKKLARYRIRR